MKPVKIVLLVIAGALGGAVVTKVWQKHPVRPLEPAVAQVEPPKSVPETQAAPATEQPPTGVPRAETAPAVPVEKPSPMADAKPEKKPGPATEKKAGPGGPAQSRGSAPRQPLHFHKNPPPAHPRPLQLGQAVPPAPAAPSAAAPVESPKPVDPIDELAVPPARADAPPPQPTATAPEPEPPHRVTLNAGMLIPVRLVDGLSSERNLAGDLFAATLDRELVVNGFVIAERGAQAEGRVVSADRGTKVHGNAAIAVELTRIHTSDGQDVIIQTDSFERRSRPDHEIDAAKIGGGAVIGAIIGAIAGGGKGAAAGAGAGGGVGAGDVLLTRKPATLPSETRIRFRLRAPVTLTEKKG